VDGSRNDSEYFCWQFIKTNCDIFQIGRKSWIISKSGETISGQSISVIFKSGETISGQSISVISKSGETILAQPISILSKSGKSTAGDSAFCREQLLKIVPGAFPILRAMFSRDLRRLRSWSQKSPQK